MLASGGLKATCSAKCKIGHLSLKCKIGTRASCNYTYSYVECLVGNHRTIN